MCKRPAHSGSRHFEFRRDIAKAHPALTQQHGLVAAEDALRPAHPQILAALRVLAPYAYAARPVGRPVSLIAGRRTGRR